MANVVENLNVISKTMENILDFVANDEELSKDFQEYLEISNLEIESEREFNSIIIQYMLDMKMQNGLRVLEYYRRNSDAGNEIVDSLINSFCSVFKVNKILSNAYEVECLTSNVPLTLVPMVKMEHLKQIGRFDYIQARIIELSGVLYILEIYDVISEYNPALAMSEAVRYMLQNPKCAYFKNDEKRYALENSAKSMYEKFIECFNSEFIITTNKKADELIEFFNLYQKNPQNKSYQDLIEKVEQNRFFKIDEFSCDDKTFMQNAASGFSNHKEIYDIALFVDKKRGLYIIPFFETFIKCFSQDIEGKKECIREFLTSDKIPSSVIKYAYDNCENFFEVINETLNVKFSNLEEVLFNTKSSFIDSGVFSPVIILFNSELFSNLLGIKEEQQLQNEEETCANIGRNELCPCGSGLKYKKCCGKN